MQSRSLLSSSISIGLDLASLISFGLLLTHGPINGLIQPIIQDWWLSIVLLAQVGLCGVYGTLLLRRLPALSPAINKLNAFFSHGGVAHRLGHGIVWVGLLALGFIQSLWLLTSVFVNFIYTSNSSEPLALGVIISLVILSSLALAALVGTKTRLHSKNNPALVQKMLARFPTVYVVLFALAGTLFPVWTIMLSLRLLDGVKIDLKSELPSNSLHIWFGIGQSLLGLVVLNMLHIEVAVAASSALHPMTYYLERVLVIFLLLYLPYKLALNFSSQQSKILQTLWSTAYLGMQLILVYVFL